MGLTHKETENAPIRENRGDVGSRDSVSVRSNANAMRDFDSVGETEVASLAGQNWTQGGTSSGELNQIIEQVERAKVDRQEVNNVSLAQGLPVNQTNEEESGVLYGMAGDSSVAQATDG